MAAWLSGELCCRVSLGHGRAGEGNQRVKGFIAVIGEREKRGREKNKRKEKEKREKRKRQRKEKREKRK